MSLKTIKLGKILQPKTGKTYTVWLKGVRQEFVLFWATHKQERDFSREVLQSLKHA
jgi:hypothetical protein